MGFNRVFPSLIWGFRVVGRSHDSVGFRVLDSVGFRGVGYRVERGFSVILCVCVKFDLREPQEPDKGTIKPSPRGLGVV